MYVISVIIAVIKDEIIFVNVTFFRRYPPVVQFLLSLSQKCNDEGVTKILNIYSSLKLSRHKWRDLKIERYLTLPQWGKLGPAPSKISELV